MPRFYNQFVTLCDKNYSHLLITDSKGIYTLTVLIDNDALERVKYYRWSYNGKVVKSFVTLSEFITGVKLNSWTTLIFKNGDRRDFRRENLAYVKSGVPIPGVGGEDLPPGIFRVGGHFVYRIPYGLDSLRFKSTSLSSVLAVMVKVIVESEILTFTQLSDLFIQSGWKLDCVNCYYLAYSVLESERKNFYPIHEKLLAAIRWHKQFGKEPLVQSYHPGDFETTLSEHA